MDIPISDEEFDDEEVQHIVLLDNTAGRISSTRPARETRSAPYEMAGRQLPLRPHDPHGATGAPQFDGQRTQTLIQDVPEESNPDGNPTIPVYIIFKNMSKLNVEMDYYNYPKGFDWQWHPETQRYWYRTQRGSWYQYWTVIFTPFLTTSSWDSHLIVATNGQIFSTKWVSHDHWESEHHIFTAYAQSTLA